MKKILIIFALLLLTGCTAILEELEGADSQADGLVDSTLDRLNDVIIARNAVEDFDSDNPTKATLTGGLKQAAIFNQKVKELEGKLDLLEKMEFDHKEDFISVYREYIKSNKKIVAVYSELYRYELDYLEQDTLEQEKDKLQDLSNAIQNCRCRELNCEMYYEDSLEYLGGSIEVFERMRDKYGLTVYQEVVDTWSEEKDLYEKYTPELITKSENYGIRNCYKIQDDYNDFLREIESVESTTGNAITDAISEKWVVPIMEVYPELNRLADEIDIIHHNMGYEVI